MENTTEDRLASAAERARELTRDSLEELIAELDQGRSESLLAVLRAFGKFHDYSWKNTMLIVGQRPDATRVAGYRTWKKLGRQVRKGEKGLLIVAPTFGRRDEKEPAKDDESVVRGFRAAHVFDISQTEGDPLPELEVTSGDPAHHTEGLWLFAELHGIKIEYSDAIGLANGVSQGGRILIRRGLEPADEFATLVHEIAHEMLHHGVPNEERPTLTVRETEAEAVAFAVSNAIGLDVKGAARDYIQLYRGDAAVLGAALDRVHRVSSTVVTYLKDEDPHAADVVAFAA